MESDDSGDMGFMEAMIATMTVVLVLMAFLGLAVGAAGYSADPTAGLDADLMEASIVGGEFVAGFEGYIGSYVDARGLSGATVNVTVPGGFCAEVEPVVVGEMEGGTWTRYLTAVVGTDDGRSVLAVYEVVLCGRATGASSRWWTPCCSWPSSPWRPPS